MANNDLLDTRRLLELSAKASGLNWNTYVPYWGLIKKHSREGDPLRFWDPINEDTDVLWLACQTKMTIQFTDSRIICEISLTDGCSVVVSNEFGSNRELVIRNTIVECAALYGEKLNETQI